MTISGNNWRPIDTALKDGTEIIYQDDDGAISTCAWQADDCGFDWYDIHGDQIAYPRRWIPKPAAAEITGRNK